MGDKVWMDGAIRDAMAGLHAREDVCEQVMARAGGARRRRRGRAVPLAAAMGIAAVGLMGAVGTAGAVVTADPLFFIHAWTGRSEEGSSSWDVLGNDDRYLYSLTRDYTGVSAEEASQDMSSAVEGVGYSCELAGYTLSIDSMVVDSNGCGAVTYTLANPDGVKLDDRYGLPGELVLNGDAGEPGDDGLDAVQMLLPHTDFGFASSDVYYDVESASATELHGTIYFASGDKLDAVLAGVAWRLAGHEGTGSATVQRSADTAEFAPTKVVDAKEFAGEGGSAYLSPMSLRIELPGHRGEEFVVDRIALNLEDGSEHVVKDGEAMNYYNGFASIEEGATWYVLSGLVDVNRVESVTVTGRCDGAEETCTFSAM